MTGFFAIIHRFPLGEGFISEVKGAHLHPREGGNVQHRGKKCTTDCLIDVDVVHVLAGTHTGGLAGPVYTPMVYREA